MHAYIYVYRKGRVGVGLAWRRTPPYIPRTAPFPPSIHPPNPSIHTRACVRPLRSFTLRTWTTTPLPWHLEQTREGLPFLAPEPPQVLQPSKCEILTFSSPPFHIVILLYRSFSTIRRRK